MRESLFDARLKGVIPAIPDGLLHAHARKLRPWAQETAARNIGRKNRVRAEKRIGERLAQKVDGLRVADRARAQVLCRRVIELMIDPQPRSAITHVSGFDQELPL